MHTPADNRQQKPADRFVRPSIAFHKGGSPLWRSGCGYLIADKSFVSQTTPHFGCTSREVSYSVPVYDTTLRPKSKQVFGFFPFFATALYSAIGNLFIMMKSLSKML